MTSKPVNLLQTSRFNHYRPSSMTRLIDYFCLFIVATCCPSEGCPRRHLVVTGDSARIQDEITESSSWFFNMPDE